MIKVRENVKIIVGDETEVNKRNTYLRIGWKLKVKSKGALIYEYL